MAWRLLGVWRWRGRGHGIGAVLRLANGVVACWGVEVKWAWPRVGVATGLGPRWFWPMAWRLVGMWTWSGHGIGAVLVLANGVAACWGVDVEWARTC